MKTSRKITVTGGVIVGVLLGVALKTWVDRSVLNAMAEAAPVAKI